MDWKASESGPAPPSSSTAHTPGNMLPETRWLRYLTGMRRSAPPILRWSIRALIAISIGPTFPQIAAPSTRIIQTVAGTGQAGYTGDGGPAAEARLNNPF